MGQEQALPGLRGLLRSVRTPEFAGTVFHEVEARSALNEVRGPSPLPFRWTVNPYRGCSHACTYCLDPSTLVLMADGRHKPIGDLALGDEIVGTQRRGAYRRYIETRVLAKWPTRKRAYRIILEDGTELIASGDHRFLTERGWKHVARQAPGEPQRPYLTTSNRLLGFGLGIPVGTCTAPVRTVEYQTGYLTGMIRGDGMLFDGNYPQRTGRGGSRVTMFRLALADDEGLVRTQTYLVRAGIHTTRRPFAPGTPTRRPIDAIFTSRRADTQAIREIISWPADLAPSWAAGFLAGIFDAEGSCSRGVLRISNADDEILTRTTAALGLLDIPHVRERARANGVATIRVTGGLASRRRFFALTGPVITRKLGILGDAVKTSTSLRVMSVEDLGHVQEMIDITTGTGDFVANGVISHNCFARNTHTYLDLDAGHDFDSQIIVKVNVARVLEKELSSRRWRREPVAMGTNTDPYQRAEGRYGLMPDIVRVLARAGTPMSILTKGTVLNRDLPLLGDVARDVPVGLGVSITLLARGLQRRLEPGTPSPEARLDLVRRITDAGLPCGVMVAPVLPLLTDSTEALDALLARIAEAGASGATVLALHLRRGTREWFLGWLNRERPDLVPAYQRLYRRGAYVDPGYRRALSERVGPLLRRYGLAGGGPTIRPATPPPPEPGGEQLSLLPLPSVGPPAG
ncbi:intein-containing Rv2578c family radical SAM protein [Pseudonocardia sp. DLS-67]